MKQKRARPWAASERAILLKRYSRIGNVALAKELDRSVQSVVQMAYKMGLCKTGRARAPRGGLLDLEPDLMDRFGGPVAPAWVTGVVQHIIADD